MKTKLIPAALATLLMFAPLMAVDNAGFENFTLSRNDFKSNPSRALADFSSRTRTEVGAALANFNSCRPIGLLIKIR